MLINSVVGILSQIYIYIKTFNCILYIIILFVYYTPIKLGEKSPSTGPISGQALWGGLAAGIRGTLLRSVALEGKASRA